MLTFILGPSGSGKSRRMLAELRTRAENGQRSLLIVPEQFTSSTEGMMYVYEGSEHKHEAQTPKVIDINSLK